MPSIGITEDGLLVYQGDGRHGHPVWPAPVITRATLINSEDDWLRVPPQGALFTLAFREDSFDAVTRVRRGRLYSALPTQPDQWEVRPHPALGGEEERQAHRNGGTISKRVFSFDSYRGLIEKPNRGIGMTIALGTTEAVSAWKIVGVERVLSNEDLVTLRARSNLGVLPDIDAAVVPPGALGRVQEALGKAADAVFRESPASIIDRCRDAAAVALAHWLAEDEGRDDLLGKDLGDLYKLLDRRGDKAPRMLITVATLIAYLHARGKPNEQAKRGHPPPSEGDAETAIAALGTLLRELRWVRT